MSPRAALAAFLWLGAVSPGLGAIGANRRSHHRRGAAAGQRRRGSARRRRCCRSAGPQRQRHRRGLARRVDRTAGVPRLGHAGGVAGLRRRDRPAPAAGRRRLLRALGADLHASKAIRSASAACCGRSCAGRRRHRRHPSLPAPRRRRAVLPHQRRGRDAARDRPAAGRGERLVALRQARHPFARQARPVGPGDAATPGHPVCAPAQGRARRHAVAHRDIAGICVAGLHA